MNPSSKRALLPVVFHLAVVTLVLGIATNATAQERKVALVIGNGAYRSRTMTRLANPPNDARAMTRTLESIGFDVTTLVDATVEAMDDAIDAFTRAAERADVGIVFYSGHGVQVDGINWLLPVDAEVESPSRLRREAVDQERLLEAIETAAPRVSLVLLDACRDNPFTSGSSKSAVTRGLAAPSTRPPQTMIVYATAAGDTADDGDGETSPFTTALLHHLPTPGLDVYDLYRNVSADVQSTTAYDQNPELFGNVTVRYSLVPESGTGTAAATRPASSTQTARTPGFSVERSFGSVRVSVATAGTVYLDGTRMGSIGAGQTATLSDVETGSRRVEVRYANGERENSTVTVRTGSTAAASFSYTERPDTSRPLRNEIFIQGGTFRMGSASGGDDDERPVHTVRVDDFSMMATEVTFQDYDAFARATGRDRPDDWGWGRGTRPVINVTWHDAVAYANWLSERDGLTRAYRINGTNVTWNRNADGWRLPTEAEWEYAARGGQSARNTTYAGSSTVSTVAWYSGNANSRTQPVGQKLSNELGLYDMSGNVWEWCYDWYDGDYYGDSPSANPAGPTSGSRRVLRGGGWDSAARRLRVANRFAGIPENRYGRGFRLVRAQFTGR